MIVAGRFNSAFAPRDTGCRSVPVRGFVGLVVIILIGCLILAIGVTTAYIGQTQLAISGQLDRAQSARQTAAACIDEALYRLKLNPFYSGGSVLVGTLTCTVAVSGAGNSRTVAVSAVDGDFSQSVMVTAVLRQNVPGNARAWSIDSWIEADP